MQSVAAKLPPSAAWAAGFHDSTAAPSPTENPLNVVFNIFSHEKNLQLNSRVEATVLLQLRAVQGFAAEE